MSVIKEYFNLTQETFKEYGDKSVVLMQVGSFYEVYALKTTVNNETVYEGSNIQDIANICDFRIANKHGTYQNKAVVMLGFPQYNLDKFIKKLQECQYTVAVYKQDENISGTSRSLLGIYSPGTWFSHESTKLSNSVSCIWIHNSRKTKIIGMSNIDIISGSSILFEYEENSNQPSFDQIERFISIHNPNEVIFIHSESNASITKIQQFSDSTNRPCHFINLEDSENINSTRATKCEKQTFQYEIFEKYFVNFNFSHELFSFSIAIQSITFLLDWIWRHNPNLIKNIQHPVFENYSNNMILANHSLKQLNIINDHNVVTNSKISCVSNFINQCNTAMGKRKTYYELVHPTFCHQSLQKIYNVTEHIIDNHDYSNTRNLMSNIKDIEKLIRKLSLNHITPSDIYFLNQDLESCKTLFNRISCDKKLSNYFNHHVFTNKSFASLNNSITQLSDQIIRTLNIDICHDIHNIDSDTNYIMTHYDNSHDLIVNKFDNTHQDIYKVQEYLSTIISAHEAKTKKTDFVSITKTDKYGYNLCTTKRRSTILTSNIKSIKPGDKSIPYLQSLEQSFDLSNISIVQGTTASNQNIINPQIKTLCNNILSTKSNMIQSQTAIFKQFCEYLSLNQQILYDISLFVTNIDYIMNLAHISQKYNYCKPDISSQAESSFFKATNLRHPLIEYILIDELYVTNDISFDESHKGYLLYGTNAVGKSSFIKSIGITIIMAQAGFYVPCSSFTFFPYKKLFTRILGNDNIFKGLSTFAVEMQEFKNIIENCCSHSIILGDELCSGTETDSAISIILAGLDYLHNEKSSYIFATHFHEIVNYDEVVSKENLHIKHMSITYDTAKDVLIYDRKLADGPGDSMYGLEVCKSLHLPSQFLINAHELRNKYNKKGKSMLDYETSRYNSKKLIGGTCELCDKNLASEVHHLQYQEDSNHNGYIKDNFHKNHVANLINICPSCHDELHKLKKRLFKSKSNKTKVIRELPA